LPSRSKRNLRSIVIAFTIAIVILASFAGYFLYDAYVSTHTTASISTFSTPYVREFPLSSQSYPSGIAVDSRGDAWFVIQRNASLGVVYSNYTMREFKVPTANLSSWGVAVDTPRNLIWFTDYSSNAVWSFNMSSSAFHEYKITSNPFAFPFQVAVDSKDNVWFTEEFADKIGELFPSNGTMLEFPIPAALGGLAGPVGLTISRNDTLWFTDPDENSIASFSNGNFHVYNFTGRALAPVGIALDASGNVWFTEHGPSLIAEFNPSTGALRAISNSLAPAPLFETLPYFCYIDSQGNVWFNEHQGNRIGRYSPSNNTMVEYAIPTQVAAFQGISGALTMGLSPTGIPWFAESFAGKIGTVNLSEPINQSIVVQSSSGSGPITLTNGSSVQLTLQLTNHQNSETHVNASISTIDLLPPVTFSFSTVSGVGNYSSVLTIKDSGLAEGSYDITVGIFSQDVIVSQIIEIQVP
jgi:virginiamycin B lyase